MEILDNTGAVERIIINPENGNNSGVSFILQRILKAPENFEASREFQKLFKTSGESQNLWRILNTSEIIK